MVILHLILRMKMKNEIIVLNCHKEKYISTIPLINGFSNYDLIKQKRMNSYNIW